jgi:tetratricopeptide (TPR) repeat protein
VPEATKKDEEILRKLLSDLMKAREWQKARVIAQHLIKLDSKNRWVHTALAVAWFEMSELDKAERCFRRALHLDSNDEQVLLYMATICAYRGDLAGQLEWAKRAARCDEGNPEPNFAIADAHIRLGQLTDAEKKLTVTHPQDIRARRMLAHLYLSLQRPDEAASEFRKALQIDFSDAALWCDLGHTLSLKGKYADALAAFQRALHLEPETALYAYNVGDAFLAMDESGKAIPYLMKAVQRDPQYSLAHYDLGLAFLRLGRYEESATASAAALRTDPEMVAQGTNLGIGATKNLGLAHMNLGDYAKAEECFRRNLRLSASTYFNLGLTLFKQGRYEESLVKFQRALEIEPKNTEYLDLLGNAYSELGRLDEAIAIEETYALAHYDRGTVLARMEGQDAAALKSFKRALELDGDLYWAYYATACIYAKRGKKKSALRSLGKAFQKGFRDMAWLDNDSDWDGLRDDGAFRELKKKYAEQP